MSVECQVNVKSQSELDIGGRETCYNLETGINYYFRVMLIDFSQLPNTLFRI